MSKELEAMVEIEFPACTHSDCGDEQLCATGRFHRRAMRLAVKAAMLGRVELIREHKLAQKTTKHQKRKKQ